ncbi:MAG: hypothetical protein LBP65_03540 [Puniceicoccales bacterium]|jgi:hypothetical protein|nr:hypothetical protein [Puniceicoccales bacterium]
MVVGGCDKSRQSEAISTLVLHPIAMLRPIWSVAASVRFLPDLGPVQRVATIVRLLVAAPALVFCVIATVPSHLLLRCEIAFASLCRMGHPKTAYFLTFATHLILAQGCLFLIGLLFNTVLLTLCQALWPIVAALLFLGGAVGLYLGVVRLAPAHLFYFIANSSICDVRPACMDGRRALAAAMREMLKNDRQKCELKSKAWQALIAALENELIPNRCIARKHGETFRAMASGEGSASPNIWNKNFLELLPKADRDAFLTFLFSP